MKKRRDSFTILEEERKKIEKAEKDLVKRKKKWENKKLEVESRPTNGKIFRCLFDKPTEKLPKGSFSFYIYNPSLTTGGIIDRTKPDKIMLGSSVRVETAKTVMRVLVKLENKEMISIIQEKVNSPDFEETKILESDFLEEYQKQSSNSN